MPAPDKVAPRRGLAGAFRSRTALLLAFSFAVMADPVSSVAYTIEPALRTLNGDLSATVGEAFGDRWSFIPIGTLVVDFVLTIAISVSPRASAAIAYFPTLAPWRLLLALALVILVGAVTWFGHLGRLVFAAMTMGFIVVSALILLYGLGATPQPVGTITDTPGQAPVIAVVLAFPVAMALATGVEAPSSAIAQLGQLDDAGRSRFGRVRLTLTLAIVGTITLGLTLEAAHLQVGIPPGDSTQIAELALLAAPGPVFAAFQLVTALLLLSAASSSYQAGPGLLKAFAATPTNRAIPSASFLPRWNAQTPTAPPTGGLRCSPLWPALSPPQPAVTTRNSYSFTPCQSS